MRFEELLARPTLTPTPGPVRISSDADHQRRYALAALEGERQILAATPEGGRNHQLNVSAFSLAQLIPHISEDEITSTLGVTAQAIGLAPAEIRATLASGIRAGRRQQRAIPEAPCGETGAQEVSAAELLSPEHESAVAAFWDQRPVLAHIRDFAYSRMCAPWAVLGGCLLRAVAATAYHVVLPPAVGGVGSLNLLIGLVGPSGSGKGASESAAADALTWPQIHSAPLGSGEGITHAYARPNLKRGRDGDQDEDHSPLIWEHRSVLFTSPEIDQVAAIQNRRGSTLTSQLRSAYSGERLGMQYADASRRIILPAHQYRFGLSVGIQPDRADWLLADAEAGGGTPQRFVWLPVTDPSITADPEPEPEAWSWTPPLAIPSVVPGSRRDRAGRFVMPVPEVVTRRIREAHAARARGEGEALDGHALYTRLKVAGALAVLDQRLAVTVEDWLLAGTVMAVSDVTRARVQASISVRARASQQARARMDAERQIYIEESLAEAATKRVTRTLSRALARAGRLTRAQARRRLESRDRALFGEALERLIEAGQVVVSDGERGEVVTWQG